MKPTRQIRLRVAELAAARGMDDYELASQARMNVNVIRRMFANQQVAELKLNQLARVADVLSVDVCDLFEQQ